jgi:uncharacterized protein
MVFYERTIHEEISKWADKKTIIVVTGMRRTGKTSLLRMLFNEAPGTNKVFLDMENPVSQMVFREKDYDNIPANLKAYGIDIRETAYVFLDEIQAMPELVLAVKYLFDHYDVRFYLTGSSSYYMKNLFPESLAGRKTVFELYPLSFQEFLTFKGSKKEHYETFLEKDEGKNAVAYEKTIKFFQEYLDYGGFPGVVLAESIEEKTALIDDIFRSYHQKDVKSLADFRETAKLQELIFLLLQRTGTKLDVTKLSSELGITRQTVYSYLAFLEATYFISLVSPYTQSIDREISGTKKIFVCDTGILNRFARIDQGNVLENAVYNNLRTKGEVRYYQKRTGAEIDFILKDIGCALEVKETGSAHDKKKLSSMASMLKLKENYVITKKYLDEKGFIPVTEL